MESHYGLLVRFRLHEHVGAQFDALVAVTVERVRASEPGTLVYTSHLVRERPDERIFYELYRDEAAFLAHEQQPHVRRFLQEREQYVKSYTVDILQPQPLLGSAPGRPRT